MITFWDERERKAFLFHVLYYKQENMLVFLLTWLSTGERRGQKKMLWNWSDFLKVKKLVRKFFKGI